jgi:uncharacterized membrane protein
MLVRTVATLLGIYILSLPAYFLLHEFHIQPTLLPAIAVTLISGSLFSILHQVQMQGRQAAFTLVSIVVPTSLAVEAVGVVTGLPFGHYHYTPLLGPMAFGLVPWIIPIAWTMMAYPALTVAQTLLGRPIRTVPHILSQAILASLALTAWDLMLDPHMVAEGRWIWETPDGLGNYAGIPVLNYLGWALTGFVIFVVYGLWARRAASRTISRPAATGSALPLIFYTVTWGMEVLANAYWGRPEVALVGFFGMGGFALSALLAHYRTLPAGAHSP